MKQKMLFVVALCGALVVMFGAPSTFAESLPGKNTAFFQTDALATIPAMSSDTFTATILKGKPKRVLTLTTTMFAKAPAMNEVYAWVNGVQMRGGIDVNTYVLDSTGDYHNNTAMWWLDLDEAEAANPGVFKGQPLSVDLEIWNLEMLMDDLYVYVTMTARMEKK